VRTGVTPLDPSIDPAQLAAFTSASRGDEFTDAYSIH
jgi:hypothetical protein